MRVVLVGRCCIRATLAPIASNRALLLARKPMVFQLIPESKRIHFFNKRAVLPTKSTASERPLGLAECSRPLWRACIKRLQDNS